MTDLASAADPLVLADGSVVHPDGHVVRPERRVVEVPPASEAQRIIANARRRASDLPATPKTTNAVSVVLCYMLYGLDDDEIAVITGLSVEQIGRIKTLEAFEHMHDAVIRQIMENDAREVRDIIASGAKTAAHRVLSHVNSENEAISLTAAKDVLDRAGHRPADVVEHRHKMEGALVIEVVKKDKTIDAPMIDVTGDI